MASRASPAQTFRNRRPVSHQRVNLSGRLALFTLAAASVFAQSATPEDPVKAITQALEQHQVVMFGELHSNRQEYELISRLIAAPEFSRLANDIVVEFGNALYQNIVDQYVVGEDVSFEQLSQSWRNTLGLGLGSDRPASDFYAAVRAVNLKLPKNRRIRVLCGDPPVDWAKVQTKDDLQPFVPVPDQHYAKVVREQVLAKGRRALLIMGSGHFRRRNGEPGAIEKELRQAGASTFVILAGSNIVGAYDDVDSRLLQWKRPWVLTVKATRIGSLLAQPLLMGSVTGNPLAWGTLSDSTDAFLFLGPPDELTQFRAKRSDVIDTPYAKEVERRLGIIFGRVPPDFLPQDDTAEIPQFPRNHAAPPPITPPKPKP